MLVNYSLQGEIATITLDDGKKNALSPDMLSALNDALDQAEAAKAVVVLAGRAEVFSGGFDLKVLMGGGEPARKMVDTGFRLGERLLSWPAPVVIACPGHAIAMGAFLLASVDYRIGVSGPYRIQANEVALGITMPHFGIEICRQRLNPAHLNRAVNNSEVFDPQGALAAGFLDRVVDAAELSRVTQEVAEALAKLDRSAHAATKLRLRAASLKALRAAIEADDEAFKAMLQG